ncbi:hypothetical protein [Gorillibacterium massiliense]|uniref:hypothetical protein n=1 Tax=Gorillibacterium massiliense TaxID=1280390 RepID=UPI0004B954CF|nr:hypothetical protein [Gorillibacterium massiliense]
MNWKQKLGSRKFWALITSVVTSICVLVNAGDDTTTKIVGLIGAVGSAVIYMLAEAHVDGKSAQATASQEKTSSK